MRGAVEEEELDEVGEGEAEELSDAEIVRKAVLLLAAGMVLVYAPSPHTALAARHA